MTQEIKILGNSTATVEIEKDQQGRLFVKKSCVGKDASRLLLQASKQNSFDGFGGIKTPKIFETKHSENRTELRMEYINGLDFIRFTNLANKNDFIEVIQKLINLINQEFEESNLLPFPLKTWNSKVKQVIHSCSTQVKVDLPNIEKILLSDLPEHLPIGKCHGDLTFSNVMVERDKTIYVFDFLDPPIESPYEDVAKFLQDAQFFWSLQKFNDNCDKTKVKIYWNYAAQLLENRIFERCDRKILKKFQLLGLLRIVPYTKDVDKLKFLEGNLQGLLDDFNSTMCR